MILDEIIDWKRREVAEKKARAPLAQIEKAARRAGPRPFDKSLAAGGRLRVLAEIKRSSPSAGAIRKDVDPAVAARSMERAGASAISVLTDAKYFGGSLDDLRAARSAASIPVLQKDFVIDAWQVYEAAAAGADAILLIVRVLTVEELRSLYAEAKSLSLGCLVETHTSDDLKRAVDAGARLIGINNRDLATFTVDIGTTLRLMPEVPRGISVVSQSGISTPEEARRLYEAGVSAIQVGESLMRARDPGAKIAELLSLIR